MLAKELTAMLTKKLTFLFCCLIGCGFVAATPPNDSLLLRDYRFTKQADPWLTSRNAAGLVRFACENMAEAELSLTREKGSLTNFDGSPDVWQADAAIESFYRFSQRTVLYGSMSYQSFTGKDMGGSAFTPHTAHRPFDIVEDSLTNHGEKHMDTYHLVGGAACSVTDDIVVGLRLDYTAANYAKYKDLRHQNKLMDLRATTGITYQPWQWLMVGADYQYHRNVESITFGTFGTSDKVYKSLIDYACFMGHVEQFGSEGYTDKSREMPLVNDYHGGSLQLGLHFDEHTQLFNELSYAHQRGYYGRKSPYTITYSEHQSDNYQYSARISCRENRSMYLVDFTMNLENLENKANTYREAKNASQATYYEYFTPVKTANKLWADYSLTYTLHLGMRGATVAHGLIVDGLPTWTIQAGVHWMNRKQTAYAYPYYHQQDLHSNELFGSLTYRLPCRHGLWSFAANASFLQGEGDPVEELTYQMPSDKQPVPATMQAYLYREYQYLTAAQYAVGGQLKYAIIFPGSAIKTYARLSATHRKANQTYAYSQGCDHWTVTLAIGCSF